MNLPPSSVPKAESFTICLTVPASNIKQNKYICIFYSFYFILFIYSRRPLSVLLMVSMAANPIAGAIKGGNIKNTLSIPFKAASIVSLFSKSTNN
jgi:hypothetical protein